MTIVIDVDQETQQRLASEAIQSGKTLEEYAAEVLKNAPAQPTHTSRRPNLGFAAGRGIWISDDFDEPLEEFKEYM